MRTVVAGFRTSTSLLLLSVLLFAGCSGGSDAPTAHTKETGPPEGNEGMVWNEDAQSWEYPPPSGGYDRESGGYGDGYESSYANDGYGDDSDNNDGGTSNDEVADASQYDDGYQESGDAYAADSGDSDSGTQDNDDTDDAYASAGNRNSSDDSVDDSYGANDYGGGDSIRPPADMHEQRDRAREAARNRGGYEEGYAAYSSDGSSGASGYGYGDGGGNAGYDAGGYGAPGGGGGSSVYKDEIEPLLRARCYNCHGGGPRGKKGDLELHNPDVIADSKTVVPYNPDDSELFIRVEMEEGERGRMPPEGQGLSTQEVALIKKWIQDGANYGGGGGGRNGGYGDGYGGGDQYANSGRGDDGYGRGGRDDEYDDRDDPYGQDGRGSEGPPPPKNLAEAASVSFQKGDDLEAMNQLYAQSLLNKSEAAKQVLDSYQYFPLRRRATLAVRWGIGVTYKAKYNFKGAPRPPGVNQELRGLDDDDEEENAYDSIEIKNEALDYYAGDIGDELIFRLKGRIERGYYGPILQNELKKRLEGGGEDDEDSYGGDYDDGGYGRRGGGGYGSSDGGYGSGSGGSSDRPEDDEVSQVMPGVVMLGRADRKTLFSRAEEQSVDALVTIDILTEVDRRQKIVNSEFRVRLYDVTDSKTMLASTGKIKNVDLQKKRAKDPEDKTIENEIGKIFAVADNGATIKEKKVRPFKVVKFPTSTSDKAKASILKTVRALLKNKDVSPLTKLSEVKFYESRGLMSSKHAAKAFEVIDASKAKQLTSVSDENKLTDILSEWLVIDEPLEEDDESDDEDGGRRSRPRSREFR